MKDSLNIIKYLDCTLHHKLVYQVNYQLSRYENFGGNKYDQIYFLDTYLYLAELP